jgi:hypothetical protein
MTSVFRHLGLLMLLGGAILTVSAAYAASMSLSSSNVMALGGTGSVSVNCPASGCAVSQVAWTVSSSSSTAPTISGAKVTWTTAQTSGHNYDVYVTIFSGTTVVGSGSATQAASGSAVTTSVTITAASGSITPASLDHVEVDIVQTS